MKKLLLLLFIFPLFVACSDDDGPSFDENLIGKWYKKPGNYLIDSIEFTSDFKYRESRYNSITKTSSWSNWVDYSLVNEYNIYKGKKGLVIFLENVKYPYRIDQEEGKTIMWTDIRGMKEGYIAIFTKVE